MDTGSTHNFVDYQMIKKAGVKLQSVPSFTVTVANGDQLKTGQRCSGLIWEV